MSAKISPADEKSTKKRNTQSKVPPYKFLTKMGSEHHANVRSMAILHKTIVIETSTESVTEGQGDDEESDEESDNESGAESGTENHRAKRHKERSFHLLITGKVYMYI